MKSIIAKWFKHKKEREDALKTIQEIHVAVQQLTVEVEELKRMTALIGADVSWNFIDDSMERPGKIREIVVHALQSEETQRRINEEDRRIVAAKKLKEEVEKRIRTNEPSQSISE